MSEVKKTYSMVTAAITPFDSDGNVQGEAIEQFCDFQAKAKVDALFAVGSTGEFSVLGVEARKEAAEHFSRACAGKLPLWIHTGALRLDEMIELTEHAVSLDVDAVAAVPPFYFPYDDAALENWFSQLAEAAGDTTVYLYNFPGAARNDLKPSFVKEMMAKHKNIRGVKDTSQNYVRYVDYLDALGPDAEVLMGSDAMVLAALVMGGTGCISATATCFPELMVGICEAWQQGDLVRGRRLQLFATRLRLLFGKAPGVAIRKMGLEMRGMNYPVVKRPLRQMTQNEIEAFKDEVKKLEEEFEFVVTAPIA